MLTDISKTGARLVLNKARPLPKHFVLDLSGNIAIRRLCELVWQDGPAVGVMFPALDTVQSKQFGLK